MLPFLVLVLKPVWVQLFVLKIGADLLLALNRFMAQFMPLMVPDLDQNQLTAPTGVERRELGAIPARDRVRTESEPE